MSQSIYRSLSTRELSLAVIASGLSVTPFQILLALLALQPLFDFSGNPVLDVVRHILLRCVALFLLVITIADSSRNRGAVLLPRSGLKRPLILYIGSAVVSVLVAIAYSRIEPDRAIGALATLLLLCSLTVTIPYWIRSIEDVLHATRVFLYSITIVALIGLAETVQQFFLPAGMGERVRSVFHDPNIFARFALIGIFFLLPMILIARDHVISRKWAMCLAAVCLIDLMFSLSRSGYLTFFVGCLVFTSFVKERKWRIRIATATITLSVLGFIFLFTQRAFIGTAFFEASTLNRIALILGGLDMIRQHWFFGIGYTNFGNYFGMNYVQNFLGIPLQSYLSAGYATSIHNWLVEVWAEQGIIGLIAFVWLFFLLFKRLRSARATTSNGMLSAILAGYTMMFFVFLFHGFFYHTFMSQFFFWVLTGFAMGAVRVASGSQPAPGTPPWGR